MKRTIILLVAAIIVMSAYQALSSENQNNSQERGEMETSKNKRSKLCYLLTEMHSSTAGPSGKRSDST